MTKQVIPELMEELESAGKFQQIQDALTAQNVNMQNAQNQRSALMIGCLQCQNELVRRALELGADIDQKDSLGCQPIHIAAIGGNVDAIRELLMAGADINALGGTSDRPPLAFAVYHCHINVVQFLLQNSADVMARGKDKETNLHMAAGKDNVEIAELLIKAGAKHIQNKKGITPYDLACRYAGPKMQELLYNQFLRKQ